MKIPKSYKIHDNKYKVKFVDGFNDTDERGILLGRFDSVNNMVYILKKTKRNKKNTQELTFFHEFVHSLLYAMGDDDLSNNERFVEGLARCLKQAINTMEFE